MLWRRKTVEPPADTTAVEETLKQHLPEVVDLKAKRAGDLLGLRNPLIVAQFKALSEITCNGNPITFQCKVEGVDSPSQLTPVIPLIHAGQKTPGHFTYEPLTGALDETPDLRFLTGWLSATEPAYYGVLLKDNGLVLVEMKKDGVHPLNAETQRGLATYDVTASSFVEALNGRFDATMDAIGSKKLAIDDPAKIRKTISDALKSSEKTG